MGLDDHLKATVIAGLIEKYRGAVGYLNHRQGLEQVSRTLICRISKWQENLDIGLPTLFNKKTPLNHGSGEDISPKSEICPTHVVTGITYGVEAYCVLTQELNDNKKDEEAREAAEEYLSNIAAKMEEALKENFNLTDFKDQLKKEEKKQMSRLKCHLYVDLQTKAIHECSVLEAYKYCLKLIQQVRKSDVRNTSKVVPIAVHLFPLKVIMEQAGGVLGGAPIQYQDVDAELIDRCYQVLDKLEQVDANIDVVRKSNKEFGSASFNQLEKTLTKYKELMKMSLKNGVMKTRKNGDEDEMETVVNIVETHPLFSPSQLKRWLRYKQAEFEMISKITKNKIVLLADQKELEKELSDSLNKNYALVMSVPPLDERTNDILLEMKNYVETYTRLVDEIEHSTSNEDSDENNGEAKEDKPWHMIERKQKDVLMKVSEFAAYADKNKHLENKVQFLILFGERGSKKLSCRYSVYEDETLLQSKMKQLPGPPTMLQVRTSEIRNTNSAEINIYVKWNYEDLDFPCHFIVEYQLNDKPGKIQRKTTKPGESQMRIPYKIGSTMKIRVATDSCIGQSEFSETIDVETVLEANENEEANLENKSEHTIEISKAEIPATSVKNETGNGGHETISEVRFAERIAKNCKTIGRLNGMDLYAVPLIQSTESSPSAQRFTFKETDGLEGKMQHKTILIMGATGSGKTTLINCMINYIFDVQWEDPFRFQLIQEQVTGSSKAESQTSHITAYVIHHAEGFRIPYSLTIVDTPGYGDTKGLDRDQEITNMVRKFFEDDRGIQELDVIGFVVQASLPRLTPTQKYIFDSVLSIFGNDVKENINFLLPFADSQVPTVLKAIAGTGLPYPKDPQTGDPVHHKFNNSSFFCFNGPAESEASNDENTSFDHFFWRMGIENFKRFFSVLTTKKTQSLVLTKQVLDERKRLEATVDGLQPLIKIGLTKMEEMRKTKMVIANSQAQIEANENVHFEVEVTRPKKVDIPAGQYLTNCNKCYVTCHNPCQIPNDERKVNCDAMDRSMPEETRTCKICPNKCIWNMHSNQSYRWEYVKEKQVTSSGAIKQKYESELKKKLTAKELVEILEKDVEDNNKIVLERVDTVTQCIKKLDEIALRPNPFSTPEYIDLIITTEQREKGVGYKDRIESLEKLREMAIITSKVRNKKNLLSLDEKDDELGDGTVDHDDHYRASVHSQVDQDIFESSFIYN
jgi:GTP-binding protein EngB required for normal cell division